jgi:hypothetical protein
MSEYQGLTVRHHDRHTLSLRAELIIVSAQRGHVRLGTKHASASNDHTLRVVVRDASRGGLGVESEVFLPRMTQATVRVYADADATRLLLEREVRVRRTVMATEQPSYALGLQFIGEEEGADIIARLSEAGASGGAAA